MRRETPQLAGLNPSLVVVPGAVPLRDDPSARLPAVLGAHVEFKDLAALGAHEQLGPLHEQRLDARRLSVVAAERLTLEIRDGLYHLGHVYGEHLLHVLREKINLPVLPAGEDVIVVDKYVVHRALVQSLKLLDALLAAVRPLVDDPALRPGQRRAVGVKRDGQDGRNRAHAPVHAPLADQVSALHHPELYVLHPTRDQPPVVRVVLAVEHPVLVPLAVRDHAPGCPVVDGHRVVVVQTDGCQVLAGAVER